MNYSLAVFLVAPTVRAIMCSYEGESRDTPTLFKTRDTAIKVGDIVTVPTKTRVKFTCVKVTDVDVTVDLDSTVQMDWIAAPVALADYEQTVANETVVIEKVRAATFAKKRNELARSLLEDPGEFMKQLPGLGGAAASDTPKPADATA